MASRTHAGCPGIAETSLQSGSEALSSPPAIPELRLSPWEERARDTWRLVAEGEVLAVQGL